MSLEVDRRQVLAYRAEVQGLGRAGRVPSELEVFALGVQDTPAGSARLALAARLPDVPDGSFLETESLALVWSIRGAPHLVRAADLPRVAAALWPLSEEDALARLGPKGSELGGAGLSGLAAFAETAEALHAIVTGPMTKGQMSAAVTRRVSDPLSAWCEGCQARHINEQLFRLAALPGGVQLRPGSSPLTFVPIDPWPGVPGASSGTEAFVLAYLRLLGPATAGDVAGYLGTRPSEIKAAWPEGVAEVRVEGRQAWLPEDAVETLKAARPGGVVRLLPPFDPLTQARDRALVLPDKRQRAALWQGLWGPGALLVDSEIAGVWRARSSGRSRVRITLSPFERLSKRVRSAIDDEAERVRLARGAPSLEVDIEAA